MRFGRRGMLAAAAATLAGCAPALEPPHAGPVPSPTPSAPDMPTPRPTTVRDDPPSSPSPSVVEPVMPTRDEVIAEFGDRRPTQWGLEVDGVVLRTGASGVALTFDACGGGGGSGYDEVLIRALVDTGTPATLFLNSRWIEANPETTRDLAANPLFELANHGTAHVPLSVSGRQAYGITGTASVGEVYDEVAENQLLMTSLLGAPPRFFRSGTAHLDDVAAGVVHAMGLVPVNFDINADGGATFTAAQVRAAMGAATAGSISIAHFNRPGSGTGAGIVEAIVEMKERGAVFATLGDALA